MNSYFDQQWDQQLAGRPVALAAFTRLSPAAQERIVGYVQSCDDTWEANRRIRLAEVLRQLPLSFFGNRDLTDLTTTIMGDTETLEKAFSHFYPAMHGALISTALISTGMLLYDWRMALALLWVVPASLLMVYLSRRMEKRPAARPPTPCRRCWSARRRSRRATRRRGISPT